MTTSPIKTDPTLDLVLVRELDVPVELVWHAWTTPESIKQWFVPKPWEITACDVDLRPGGVFSSTMRSPEGNEFQNMGCYLEVVPNERLVWTDTLLPGFRPSPKPFFTAALILEPNGSGTRYTAIALHGDATARKTHEDMGFEHGWGTVVEQLVAHIKASMH